MKEEKSAAEQKKSEEDAKQLLLENADIVKKLTDEEFSENMNSKAQDIATRNKAQSTPVSDEALKAAEDARLKNQEEEKHLAVPKSVDDQLKTNLAESIASMTSPPEPVKNIFAKNVESPTPKAVKTVIASAVPAAVAVPAKTEPVKSKQISEKQSKVDQAEAQA